MRRDGGSIETRTSVLRGIKDLENDQAWRRFAAIYSDLVRQLALGAKLTHHEAEEVLQDVLLSVARNIENYAYRRGKCSFKHWLSNVTRWRITDQKRRRAAAAFRFPPASDNSVCSLEGIEDPAPKPVEANLEGEWEQHLVDTALRRVKQWLNPKHAQIFHLYVEKDWPVEEVCRLLKVSRTEVYLAKLRVGRSLQAEVAALQTASVRDQSDQPAGLDSPPVVRRPR